MRRYRSDILIVLGIVALTLAGFSTVAFCKFVNYDDAEYVSSNPHVLGGLTAANVRWAFTAFYAANWHPLTWLSLQLDATLFGADPAAFHLTNLALHAANALLLYAFLRVTTAAPWRSGLVAALFAIHPLHVESVAWIAERKDVLSTFFWMLTLVAYAAYARRPGVLRYLGVLLAFVLGLMAKPMLVTLPFVLLLLDAWPLQRLQLGNGPGLLASLRQTVTGNLRLVVEKLPLFALTAASCAVTLMAQKSAVRSLTQLPWGYRILNAINAYGTYLGMTLWPRDLNVLYVHPGDTLPLWRPAIAGVVLVLITLLALREVRTRPYLLVGWLWYLGTLVPVIGLVQVGEQAMADRYTYVPLVGVFLMLAWGLPDLLLAWRLRPGMLAVPVALMLLVCVARTFDQVYHWRDSGALWERALKFDAANPIAHNNLGAVMLDRGELDEAADHFRLALRLRTGNNWKASNNLGMVLMWQGRFDEAVPHLQVAVTSRPDYPNGHLNLGLTRLWQGRTDAAVDSFRRAVELQPEQARLRFHLAHALTVRGDAEAAGVEYREGLRLDPNWPAVLNRNAWNLATNRQPRMRRGFEAVLLAEEACEATGGSESRYLDTLAAAYAEVGRFADAVRTARKARELTDKDLAQQIEARIRLYEQSEPYRDGI